VRRTDLGKHAELLWPLLILQDDLGPEAVVAGTAGWFFLRQRRSICGDRGCFGRGLICKEAMSLSDGGNRFLPARNDRRHHENGENQVGDFWRHFSL
jgi:hypothetical protein